MVAAATGEAMIARPSERQEAVADAVVEYERRFSERTGAPFALSFSHGRAGLAALLRALPGDGDEVLLSPLTCKVVPLSVLAAGMRPVWVDIDAATLNLDAGEVEAARSDRTRAVLFQRTYGNAAGAAEVYAVGARNDISVVEDCAQCMPDPDAWLADAAVFSNNPGKPLPAGSGGLVVMRDPVVAERVRAERATLPLASRTDSLRPRFEAWIRNRLLGPSLYWPAFELNRRLDASYHVRNLETEIRDEVTAVSRRISTSQARAGLHWLAQADTLAGHRTGCCAGYATMLRGRTGLELPCPQGDGPLYFFPVLINGKSELLHEAKRRRIEIIAWPVRSPIYPILDTASLRTYGYTAGRCPVAEHVATRLVGLPTHPLVRPRDIERIAGFVTAHAARHPDGSSQ